MEKIGLISSGVDMLVLFRFLSKYDLSYEIVYDDLGWPWSDKPLEFVLERARKACDVLLEKGVEKIIVPPVIEVALHQEKKYAGCILPLWMSYAKECVAKSPVGKIGFAGEYTDITNKNLFEGAVKADKLSFWWHEISMWKFYLTKLSFKSQIVHHAMKADWRYFKDALVDTIIPTSYGFFAYETILGKFLNNKKQKFHRLAEVEKQFGKLITNYELPITNKNYSITINYTGTLDHLTAEKKRMRMLQRGKEISVESSHITL